jgi:hypothetical protein
VAGAVLDCDRGGAVFEQRADTRNTPEQGIHVLDVARGDAERRQFDWVGGLERTQRGVELGNDTAALRRLPPAGPPDHPDDPAHSDTGYDLTDRASRPGSSRPLTPDRR